MINRIAIQPDNYKLPCRTKTFYYENIPLQTIGNLDYYYYLDELVHEATTQTGNMKLNKYAMETIKNKIREIYLTFSFDRLNFGKKRIYKKLRLPNISNNYDEFWNLLASDYERQISIIEYGCTNIINKRIISSSRIDGIVSLERSTIVNILTEKLIETGGELERDLLSDKFKVELKYEIDHLLHDKQLLELYNELLTMRSLAFKNNSIDDNNKKVAIIQSNLITPINSINRQIIEFIDCLDKMIDGFKQIYPDNQIHNEIVKPFEIIRDGFSKLNMDIMKLEKQTLDKNIGIDLDYIYRTFKSTYSISIDDTIENIWKTTEIRNILDRMKTFIYQQLDGEKIGSFDISNLFNVVESDNILIN